MQIYTSEGNVLLEFKGEEEKGDHEIGPLFVTCGTDVVLRDIVGAWSNKRFCGR